MEKEQENWIRNMMILWTEDGVMLPQTRVPFYLRSTPEYRKLVEDIAGQEDLNEIGPSVAVIFDTSPGREYMPNPIGTWCQFERKTLKVVERNGIDFITFYVTGFSRLVVTSYDPDKKIQIPNDPILMPTKAEVRILMDTEISTTEILKEDEFKHFGSKLNWIFKICKELFQQGKISDSIFSKEAFENDALMSIPIGQLCDKLVCVLGRFKGAYASEKEKKEKEGQILHATNVRERFKLTLALWDRYQKKLKGPKTPTNAILSKMQEIMKQSGFRAEQDEMPDQFEQDEIKNLVNRFEKIRDQLPSDAITEIEKELNKTMSAQPSSADYQVSKNYVTNALDLYELAPTKENEDLEEATQQLEHDHYGLDKVKERILEEVAAKSLNPERKSRTLCFVGPPGVGKTSLGESIAKALGREFVRIAVGGVRDVAEIRGHSRTYIGAKVGSIVDELIKCGSNNPVFMVDEIDKLAPTSIYGDPAAALLEAFDPEQNFSFKDRYINASYDLSKVIFIPTANTTYGIIPALQDRMEFLRLPGYLDEEKIGIAQNFLVPRQIWENLLDKVSVKIDDNALLKMIREYTKEAGVRNLERSIADICRKLAIRYKKETFDSFHVIKNNVSDFLGPRMFFEESLEKLEPGVSIGLAWTEYGGEILFIESVIVSEQGKGALKLTGQQGDVMQESAQIALSYLRSRAGSERDKKLKNDIHIHVPAGGVPKDGPSAGLGKLFSLYGLFKKKPQKAALASTGEITLRGKVKPIGGLKEKLVGAVRSGIKEVIIPKDNAGELSQLPKKLLKKVVIRSPDKPAKRTMKNKLIVYPVEEMEDALDLAFPGRKKPSN
jgi:ATP-dependent Lon protease